MNSNANDNHFYFSNVSTIQPQQTQLFHHHNFPVVTQPLPSPLNSVNSSPKAISTTVQNIVPKSPLKNDIHPTATKPYSKKNTKTSVIKRKSIHNFPPTGVSQPTGYSLSGSITPDVRQPSIVPSGLNICGKFFEPVTGICYNVPEPTSELYNTNSHDNGIKFHHEKLATTNHDLDDLSSTGEDQMVVSTYKESAASPNLTDTDKGKMNMEKLENTIDHVLSLAVSGKPCEGVFVLPLRLRDAAPPSSSTPRPSTPSSGINQSPAPSPRSSSPHPNQLTPAQLHQSPVNTACSSNTSGSLPSYVVERSSDIIQLKATAAPSQQQCIQSQYQPPQAVPTVLQVYPDTSGSTALHMTQHHVFPNFSRSSGQAMLTNPTSQMVIGPAVFQNIQVSSASQNSNVSISQPVVTASSVRDGQTPLFQTVNASQATITVPVSLLSPEGTNRPVQVQQKFTPDKSSPISDRYANVNNQTNVCFFHNTLAFGAQQSSVPTSVFVTSTNTIPPQPIPISSVTATSDQKSCLPNQLSSPKLEQNRVGEQQLAVMPNHPAAVTQSGLSRTPVSNILPLRPVKTVSHMSDPVTKKRQSSANTPGNKKKGVNPLSVQVPTPGRTVPVVLIPSCESSRQPSGGKAAPEHVQQLLDRLKTPEPKDLVSDPLIAPFNFVLPPYGACSHPVHLCSLQEERVKLKSKGLKYRRPPLASSLSNDDVGPANEATADLLIMQHVEGTTPIEPMFHAVKRPTWSQSQHFAPVCPSPRPASLENNLMALYSGIQNCSESSPSEYAKDTGVVGEQDIQFALLPMMACLPNSQSSDRARDRCTPPLTVQHIPNPRLLVHPPTKVNRSQHITPVPQYGFSAKTLSASVDTSASPSLNDDYQAPVVDSETGEVLGGRRPKQLTENEKVHVTFTISSSMTDSVPEVIRRITSLLGIDQNSISYQVTRAGTEITFGRDQTQPENVIRDLESHLRQHFTPLSMHLTKTTEEWKPTSSIVPVKHPATQLPPSEWNEANPLPVDDQPASILSDNSSAQQLDSTIYLEEPVSISKLLAMKRESPDPCSHCGTTVKFSLVVRRRVDELAAATGLAIRPDVPGNDSAEITFCSDDCLSRFVHELSTQRAHYTECYGDKSSWNAASNNVPNGTLIEPRLQLMVSDLTPSVPILLQPPKSSRGGPNCKRNAMSLNASAHLKRRTSSTDAISPKARRWKGLRWRTFSPDMAPQNKTHASRLTDADVLELLRNNRGVLRNPELRDDRVCVLCNRIGDGSENGPGRLLCTDLDEWMHLNCSLWCFEIYETLCGSLNNERSCYERAKRTNCSHCGELGAGLPCYNPRCSVVYHVPCAQEIGCMFFTDRGMYCPLHQLKENHPMELPTLAVNRRVYITREENEQVAQVIHEEDQRHVVRIGGMYLHSIGQLLPHQLESGRFHTQRYIFPVGFRTTRIYWSMRRPYCRARYACEIQDHESAPFFVITAIDQGMLDEKISGLTCDLAWRQVLDRIAVLRLAHHLVKIFPQYTKGEDLFGLSEPHIVRAIESLPGVDSLRDYVFNFGRLQLIAEMPLAINPSGCARSEPKMRTYIKRPRRSAGLPGGDHSSSQPSFPAGGTLLHRNLAGGYPSLAAKFNSANADNLPRQIQTSRCQQYRRLKLEVSNNITLGRSRIQGLGLFAARDLDQHTMVIEYIGELIRIQTANKREKEYEARNRGIYMFRLDEHTVIDATVCGGLARYVNHSCEPNCLADYVNFGEGGHIVISTTRKIHKGEELAYDYNFDLEDCSAKIPCHCGAMNCRNWMN